MKRVQIKAEHAMYGDKIRVSAGDHHVEFVIDAPTETMERAFNALIERAAGFSKSDLCAAVFNLRSGNT